MRRNQFNSYIDNNDFESLFNEMGWDHARNAQPIYITVDSVDYDFLTVAEKCGFQVFTCLVDVIPTAADCKKIDNQLRRNAYDYVCIFVQRNTKHHLWLTPVKTNEKRELVKTEYVGGDQADFLWSKIDSMTFELTQVVTFPDVKFNVQGAFHLNSEKVTKDFYTQFRKEHKAFAKLISGLEIEAKEDETAEQKKERLKKQEDNRDWYASIMLNRLMFCYFIQKKGFLNSDHNYLVNKLNWVKRKKGEDQFFGTFYKHFLSIMFHDGMNSPTHDSDPKFIEMYGRIPYLNGGMFDEHQLEREYEGIDIPDEAFENLFAFFNKWNWHLDTRLTASGKDINPDVLGYIFEQYINDRAAMGAYYTKEDITEYIGKNCIIPFLMDKTASATKDAAKAFEPEGWIWQMLRESGKKYIYDAVKKGHSKNWQQRIPDYISRGIDTTAGNLLERRSRWNEKTHEEFALPTEIWRETVERLQRCDSLLKKIGDGEIHSINDFITYNLNIRQFAEDVLRNIPDHRFIGHFYHALQSVTILDPTCGSGAFLFAALNILEPLYEACLDRMEEWNRENANLFVNELNEINAKYSSNRQYFIYKSIILRNLYGVDIMVEATEIAKLRLFLKMVAVVDVDKRKENLGLDPLPDIDFNIKCGNTLVGYATEKQLDDALAFGDFYANAEFKEKIDTEMNVVAKAYNLFRSEQLKAYDDNATIKQTKEMLKERLAKLNDLLNHHLYTGIAKSSDYNEWLKSHQPFHWLAEYYQIIKGNGGFDVIIGNPPYVEYNNRNCKYTIYFAQNNYANLYAYCTERVHSITRNESYKAFIVPMSITSIRDYELLRSFIDRNNSQVYVTNHAIRPTSLFTGVSQRVSIVFLNNSNSPLFKTTKYYRTNNSSLLFQCLEFENAFYEGDRNRLVPKIGSRLHMSIWIKMHKKNRDLNSVFNRNGVDNLWFKDYGETYWVFPLKFCPWLTPVKSFNSLSVSESYVSRVFGILNSTLFYLFHTSISDCWHLGKWHFGQFPVNIESCPAIQTGKLENSYKKNRIQRYDTRAGGDIYEYKISKSKPIIDEIDKVLAKHYGFTEEELDFIINYDIKYRMGDELNGNI